MISTQDRIEKAWLAVKQAKACLQAIETRQSKGRNCPANPAQASRKSADGL